MNDRDRRGKAGQGSGGKRVGRPPAPHSRRTRTPPPPGKAPRGYSASTLGIGGAIVAVVAVVIVVVVVLSTGTKSPTGPPAVTPAQPSVLAAIAAVTPAEAAQIGLPPSVTVPSVISLQPPLTSGGKPEALAILAEFCPYCGAERWALIMTFQRFGRFSNLHETTSSPWDVYPATPTFTFYKSSYSSPYVDFDPVENDGNDTTAVDTHTTLQPLTTQQNTLWSKYESHFGEQQGFPFLDIDNTFFVYAPSFDPQILHGLTQSAIASDLSNPDTPVAQNIIGTANYLTAAVCDVDGGHPGSWCDAAAIKAAARAMGDG